MNSRVGRDPEATHSNYGLQWSADPMENNQDIFQSCCPMEPQDFVAEQPDHDPLASVDATWGLESFRWSQPSWMKCANPREVEGQHSIIKSTSPPMEFTNSFDLLDFICDDSSVPPISHDDTTLSIPQDLLPDLFSIPGPGKHVVDKKTKDDLPSKEDVSRPPVKRGSRKRSSPSLLPPIKERKISKQRRPAAAAAASSLSSSSLLRVSRDHSYDSTSSSSLVPSAAEQLDENGGGKYRRMRDLNNEASKRCRLRRRMKLEDLLEEEERLLKRNKDLKIKHKSLSELVNKLKAKFISSVSNPSVSIQSGKDEFESLFDQVQI